MMQPSFTVVLDELEGRARQQEWSRTLAYIAILRGPDEPLCIAAAAGVGVENLARWMTGHLQDDRASAEPGRPTVCELEVLNANLPALIGAERGVAVFRCGQLIEHEAVRAIVNGFFTRPQGSYAIMLTGAEQIRDPGDLDLVERSAWRLLVPGPKPEWDGQNLREYNIYLWSDAPETASPELQPRLARDRAALTNWLHTPLPPESARARDEFRVDSALQIAESEATRPAAVPTSSDTPDARQVFAARTAISELRLRLRRQFQSSAETIPRALLTSLQTLELDLLDRLPIFLHEIQLPQGVTSRSEPMLQRLVEDYVYKGLESWSKQNAEMLREHERDTAAATEAAFNAVDWNLVNRVAALDRQPARYPQELQTSRTSEGESIRLEVQPTSPTMPISSLRDSVNGRSLMYIAAAGTVAPFVALLAGAGLFGMLAAGTAAAVGARLLEGRSRIEHNLEICRAYATAMIRASIQKVRASVQERADETLHQFDQQLDVVLKRLQQRLDAIPLPAPTKETESARQSADEQFLLACRASLARAAESAAGSPSAAALA